MPEGLPNSKGSLFFRGYAPAVLTTVETVRAGRAVSVVQIDVCNTDASARTVSIQLGGYPLFNAFSLAAGATLSWQGVQVLNAGSEIAVSASAADVVAIHISGSISS